MNLILFISSNPSEAARLDLDEELRDVQEAIKRATFRDEFAVKPVPAARVEDFRSTIEQDNPAVVHFSGHGGRLSPGPPTGGREVLSGDPDQAAVQCATLIARDAEGRAVPVPIQYLEGLFGCMHERVRLVVLNACHTLGLAQTLARHVDCVVGTRQAILDPTAIDFARGFYQALCDGKSVQDAFDLGKNCVREREGASDPEVLVLCCREGVAAKDLYLAHERPKVNLNQLWMGPGPASLFGRDDALGWLDTFRARGGGCAAIVGAPTSGKSALVGTWIQRLINRPDAPAVFGWSFDSRDTKLAPGEAVATSDSMVRQALEWFGDTNPAAGTREDRARRLGGLIRSQGAVLALDEVTFLQSPDGSFEDEGLKYLLRSFVGPGDGMCVLTTSSKPPETAVHALLPLSEDSAADLLANKGMKGPRAALVKLARRYECNPFALTLLVDTEKDAILCGGSDEDALPCLSLDALVAANDAALDAPGRVLLMLASAFEDAVPVAALQRLLDPPAIPGVTEGLPTGAGAQRAVEKRPRALGLIDLDRPSGDARATIRLPLPVCGHFAAALREQHPLAWREIHSRLFEYYGQRPPRSVRTAAHLAPLYRAVRHACRAGRFADGYAFYLREICRGSDLGILRFAEYDEEIRTLGLFLGAQEDPASGLAEKDAVDVLDRRAFCYRALGRPGCAAQKWEDAMGRAREAGLLGVLPTLARDLAQVHLAMGELDEAVDCAREAVDLGEAERESNTDPLAAQERVTARAVLGEVLSCRGKFDAAREEFQRAGIDDLDGFDGYRYIDFLLVTDGPAAARRHFNGMVNRSTNVLQALHPIYDARICLAAAAPGDDGAACLGQLTGGVNCLRELSRLEELTRALLWRADASRIAGHLEDARRDVDEALELAASGGLDLLAIDGKLADARLRMSEQRAEGAEVLLKDLARKVDELGYAMMTREVSQLLTRVSV